MAEGRKGPSPKKAEAQKGAKQATVTQTLVEKRGDSKIGTLLGLLPSY